MGDVGILSYKIDSDYLDFSGCLGLQAAASNNFVAQKTNSVVWSSYTEL